MSGISTLLFERQVLNKDFGTVLTELEPEITKAAPGELQSAKFPFLRRLAVVGEPMPGGAIDSWADFLARGRDEPRELVEATAAAIQPSDAALLFFSSGSTSKPKGILNAHRGVTIQMWRFGRLYNFTPEDNIRTWSANGYFWSGNFGMAHRQHADQRRQPGAAAHLRRRSRRSSSCRPRRSTSRSPGRTSGPSSKPRRTGWTST